MTSHGGVRFSALWLLNLLTVDFLIRWLGGSDNGQWELWLAVTNPDWCVTVTVSEEWLVAVVTFTATDHITINSCDEKDKSSSFWSGCNDFALSVGCNDDFALGVVMIILFYKITSSPPGLSFSRCQNNTLLFVFSSAFCEVDYTTAYHTTATLTLRDLD